MTATVSDIARASDWSWVTYSVEVAEWLVEQQQLGPAHQGAGEGDALLLAARQLGGLPVGVRLHADQA
jgi:hypothetical protein